MSRWLLLVVCVVGLSAFGGCKKKTAEENAAEGLAEEVQKDAAAASEAAQKELGNALEKLQKD